MCVVEYLQVDTTPFTFSTHWIFSYHFSNFPFYTFQHSEFDQIRKGYEWLPNVNSCSSLGLFFFLFLFKVNRFVLYIYHAPHLVFHYALAGARGSMKFNKFCRMGITLGFALFCIFKFSNILGPQKNYLLPNNEPGNLFYTDPSSNANDDRGKFSVNFLPNDRLSIKLTLGVIVLLSWANFYYYLMGFNYSGEFVLMMSRICYKDVPYFLSFYLLVVIAFSCAIAMLVNDGNPDINSGFSLLVYTFWALLKDTVSLQFFGAEQASWQQDYFFNEQNVPDSLHWLFELLVFLFQSVVT